MATASKPKTPKAPDMFDLRRPVGLLPLWAWIVVGAIAAFLYWRRHNEGGWFPTGVGGGGEEGYGGGFAEVPERRPDREPGVPEEEPAEGAGGYSGGGFAILGRDTQPSPITAGGADGAGRESSTTTATTKTATGRTPAEARQMVRRQMKWK